MTQQQVQTRPGNGPAASETLSLETPAAPDSKDVIAKADQAIQEALTTREPTLEEKLEAIRKRFGCCFKG